MRSNPNYFENVVEKDIGNRNIGVDTRDLGLENREYGMENSNQGRGNME